MVFYGIEATFLLTFLMNKLTNTLISTLHVWYILHPNIYVIKYCHGWLISINFLHAKVFLGDFFSHQRWAFAHSTTSECLNVSIIVSFNMILHQASPSIYQVAIIFSSMMFLSGYTGHCTTYFVILIFFFKVLYFPPALISLMRAFLGTSTPVNIRCLSDIFNFVNIYARRFSLYRTCASSKWTWFDKRRESIAFRINTLNASIGGKVCWSYSVTRHEGWNLSTSNFANFQLC